jgi:tripartite-type tricarboxylate transporter receptor subunit TctC
MLNEVEDKMHIYARRTLLAAAALVSAATLGQAQSYPGGKPIEMTTLFGAASASTTTARKLADGMAKILAAPVPIIDKPGAGGAVGYTYLSQQKPDGYSIVWSSNSISTTFHTGQLPFDYKNLEHVARVTIENPVLAVKADAPWKSLKELIAYAKANPEKVRVGHSGKGSQTHLVAVALFAEGGAKVIDVPFGIGQAVTNLLGDRIEAAVQFPQAFVSQAKAGNLRVLAVLGTIPDPAFPNVKTARQQGYKTAMDLWRGISAPKGTPKAVIAKLQDAIKKTVESEDFKDAGKKIGFTPAFQPSGAFTKMIAADDAVTAAVMKDVGLKKN